MSAGMEWGPTRSVTAVCDVVNYVEEVSSFSLLDNGGREYSNTRRLDMETPFLVESVSTGYDMAAADEHMVAFTVPISGTVIRQIGDRTIAAAPGKFQLLLPSSRKTAIRMAGSGPFRAISCFMPVRAIARHLGDNKLHPLAFESRTLEVRAEYLAGAALSSFMLNIGRHLASNSFFGKSAKAKALSGNLLGELLSEIFLRRATDIGGPAAARRIVDEVEERMWIEYGEPITIADLADNAGVSIRSLQIAFMRCRGESPKSLLSRIRLSQARSRLLSAGRNDTVTAVALDCGIAHLGRFSTCYRGIYGETPSQTLAKVRSVGRS